MTKTDLYVATSQDDMPHPMVPSVERKCTRCSHKVWVDRNVAEFADTTEIVCGQCFVPREGDDTVVLAHARSLLNLQGWLRRN